MPNWFNSYANWAYKNEMHSNAILFSKQAKKKAGQISLSILFKGKEN